MSRIAQIASTLKRARHLYNRTGDSFLLDSEYDQLKDNLRELDPNHPELTAVGAPPDENGPLAKVEHSIMMGSVFNSKDHEPKGQDYFKGLEIWFEKNECREVFGELKGDGLSLRVSYKNGAMVQAATRGNGIVGEDVTHNVRLFKDFPLYLNEPFTGDVRGEAILMAADWAQLGEDMGKNARNTAAGALGSKTSGGRVCGQMRFIAFDLVGPGGDPVTAHGLPIDTKEAVSHYLTKLGFQQFSMHRVCNDLSQMLAFIAEVREARPNLPHEIDGIVFYVNDLEYQYMKGMDSGNCWRSQVAFKYPATEVKTVLNGVTWQVGNTGVHTPVANLEPVDIGGVTVSNASLANPEEIIRLDVRIGDLVVVARQGDVIPKVLRLAERRPDSKVILAPLGCLSCGSPLGSRTNVDGEAGVVLMCTNADCGAKVPGKVARWAKSLEIKGLGDEVIAALTELRTSGPSKDFPGDDPTKPGYMGTCCHYRIVETVADLYRLDPKTLVELKVNGKKFGASRAKALLTEIDKSRELTIDQFLGSLGVNMLGKGRVKLIREAGEKVGHSGCSRLSELSGWFTCKMSITTSGHPSADVSVLVANAKELGIPGIADEIQKGLDSAKPIVDALLANGVKIKAPEAKPAVAADAPLAGKTFCFTGTRASPAMLEKLASLGGSEKGSVSKGLSYLVAKDKGSSSSKAVKAKEVGAEVIDMDEFKALIGFNE